MHFNLLEISLIQLEDTDYDKPLDPDDVHLPPPALPTERLLAAVEQFYCPPTHERTRNKYFFLPCHKLIWNHKCDLSVVDAFNFILQINVLLL